MTKVRLDQLMVQKKLVTTRSQAENYIKLGYVRVNDQPVTKPGFFVAEDSQIALSPIEQYVSRAALKLAAAAPTLGVDFNNKTVLDVGSSTGGFTHYVLAHGAKKVIAVDVGSNQLHPKLRSSERVELHENTDIRDLYDLSAPVDIVVVDVSFISLRHVLPHIKALVSKQCLILVLLKPQFEAGDKELHKGVIKNDRLRRQIAKQFEDWARASFRILGKVDSEISGAKGNKERFYLLKPL